MRSHVALAALAALAVLAVVLTVGMLTGSPASVSSRALSTVSVGLAGFATGPVMSECEHCKGSDWCHHCGGTGEGGGPSTSCSACHGTGSCQHCIEDEPVQIAPKPYLVRR